MNAYGAGRSQGVVVPKFCSQCGAPYDGRSGVCSQCHASLPVGPIQAAPVAAPTQAPGAARPVAAPAASAYATPRGAGSAPAANAYAAAPRGAVAAPHAPGAAMGMAPVAKASPSAVRMVQLACGGLSIAAMVLLCLPWVDALGTSYNLFQLSDFVARMGGGISYLSGVSSAAGQLSSIASVLSVALWIVWILCEALLAICAVRAFLGRTTKVPAVGLLFFGLVALVVFAVVMCLNGYIASSLRLSGLSGMVGSSPINVISMLLGIVGFIALKVVGRSR